MPQATTKATCRGGSNRPYDPRVPCPAFEALCSTLNGRELIVKNGFLLHQTDTFDSVPPAPVLILRAAKHRGTEHRRPQLRPPVPSGVSFFSTCHPGLVRLSYVEGVRLQAKCHQ